MSLSDEIYASRDQIRLQIAELVKEYLELENVDLTKTSFLTYVIDVLSTLTANMMFYQSSVYKEFFLTQAQLPESIYNLSAFLGYTPSDASYATATLLLTIPLTFTDTNTAFSIPENHEFESSDGVKFLTYYETDITVTNNAAVQVKVTRDGRVYNLPVAIDTTADMEFQFALPVRQYRVVDQEFQIDEDLEALQFTDIDVPVTGKVAEIEVYVRGPSESPESTGQLYTEFDSLYLMSSLDYGYVSRRSVAGRRLYFGNGLIGQQPEPGSTVLVTILETEGAEGNSIAGSITTGQRIYVEQGGINTVLNFTVTNPSPASGGEDEEGLQDIRSNAIANLTALNRLVTQTDYEAVDSIVQESPLTQNTIPILKRSDLKINEIQLFVGLSFEGELVPARNAFYEVPLATTTIPRNEVITVDGLDYINLFDITIDTMNSSGTYEYCITEVEQTPILVQSWEHDQQDDYNFEANKIVVKKVGNTAVFEFSYYSTEADFADCTCDMRIAENDTIYPMTNVPGAGGGTFTYTFANYLDVPEGSLNLYFTVENPNLPYQEKIAEYYGSVIFRQDLSKFMLSNAVIDATSSIVYDIPVILKSYYDGLASQPTFEAEVLQKLISSMDLIDYRMLTDFVNVKFCNTSGTVTNMQYNDTTKQDVIDVGITSLPLFGSDGDRYIIGCNATGTLADRRSQIATLIDSTAMTWFYTDPTIDDVVWVIDKQQKYVFSGTAGWVVPEFEIPLQIEVEAVKDPVAGVTEGQLVLDIKSNIVTAFQDRFGPNATIYVSEIVDVVQSTTGVRNCRVAKPVSSIFFNYDIDEFTQEELLQYGPEWIYFTEDDITVKVLSGE